VADSAQIGQCIQNMASSSEITELPNAEETGDENDQVIPPMKMLVMNRKPETPNTSGHYDGVHYTNG